MHSGMLNLGLAVVRNLTKILSSRTRFVFSSWLPSHTIFLKFWPTPTLDAVSSAASVTPFRRRETGIFVMRLARQLPVGISYTILSVSLSGSPKSSGSQSSWSLPSPRPKSWVRAACPGLPAHPDRPMPAGLLGQVENLQSRAVPLMSKGSKTHQENQNSDNKEIGTLLKPYIPCTSLSFIFYTREIITEGTQETGRLGKMYLQTLKKLCPHWSCGLDINLFGEDYMTTRIFSRFLSVEPIIGLIINIRGMQISASVWPANGTHHPERSLTGYAFQIPLDVRTLSAAKKGEVRKGISS